MCVTVSPRPLAAAVLGNALARALATPLGASIAGRGSAAGCMTLTVTASPTAVLMSSVTLAAEEEQLTAAGGNTLHNSQ